MDVGWVERERSPSSPDGGYRHFAPPPTLNLRSLLRGYSFTPVSALSDGRPQGAPYGSTLKERVLMMRNTVVPTLSARRATAPEVIRTQKLSPASTSINA
jgi:hypothetical protein